MSEDLAAQRSRLQLYLLSIGQTQTAFAKNHGINPSYLSFYLNRSWPNKHTPKTQEESQRIGVKVSDLLANHREAIDAFEAQQRSQNQQQQQQGAMAPAPKVELNADDASGEATTSPSSGLEDDEMAGGASAGVGGVASSSQPLRGWQGRAEESVEFHGDGPYGRLKPEVVDIKLWSGASEAGWSMVEACRNGAKHGLWRYHAPNGATYRNRNDAVSAHTNPGGVQGEGALAPSDAAEQSREPRRSTREVAPIAHPHAAPQPVGPRFSCEYCGKSDLSRKGLTQHLNWCSKAPPKATEPAAAPDAADSDDSSDDELPEGSFAVHYLIAERIVRKQRQFRVRWVGYGPKDDTWEAEESILTPVLIENFERLRGFGGDVRAAVTQQLKELGVSDAKKALGKKAAEWLDSADKNDEMEIKWREWLEEAWNDEAEESEAEDSEQQSNCEHCGRKFARIQALSAHRRFCKQAPKSESELLRTERERLRDPEPAQVRSQQLGQCERNPHCRRGYKHGGKGGPCLIRPDVVQGEMGAGAPQEGESTMNGEARRSKPKSKPLNLTTNEERMEAVAMWIERLGGSRSLLVGWTSKLTEYPRSTGGTRICEYIFDPQGKRYKSRREVIVHLGFAPEDRFCPTDLKPRHHANGMADGDAAEEDSDDGGDLWVACDRCKKWRRLPEHARKGLPKVWYCELNLDPLHDDCCIAEEAATTEQEDSDDDDEKGSKSAAEEPGGDAAVGATVMLEPLNVSPRESTNKAAGKRALEHVRFAPPIAAATAYEEGHRTKCADGSTWEVEIQRPGRGVATWTAVWKYVDPQELPQKRGPGRPAKLEAPVEKKRPSSLLWHGGVAQAMPTRGGSSSGEEDEVDEEAEDQYWDAQYQAKTEMVSFDWPTVQRPPAPAPICECSKECVWLRGRWFCASEQDGCGFESEVPPGAPLTPLCRCSRPCKWMLGRWWCPKAGAGGCGFELAPEVHPEPTPIAHRSSRHLPAESTVVDAARSVAAMLTASAFGLDEWCFVAPTDCGLGLFARSTLCKGQRICEYHGPRLPLEAITHSKYALQVPRVDVAIDCGRENCPSPRAPSTPLCPAIYANHSHHPNAILEHMPAVGEELDRVFLVAACRIHAGQEVRFDYEMGGQKGAHWRNLRATAKWRDAILQPTPPTCREAVVVDHQPKFAGEQQATGVSYSPSKFSRFSQRAQFEELRDDDSAEEPEEDLSELSVLPWEGARGGDSVLRAVTKMLQGSDWLQESMRRLDGKARVWSLISSHLPGRTPRECKERWRLLAAA